MKLVFGFVRDHKLLNGFTSPPSGRRVLSSKPRPGVGSDWKLCALRLSWRSQQRAPGLLRESELGRQGFPLLPGRETPRGRRGSSHTQKTHPAFRSRAVLQGRHLGLTLRTCPVNGSARPGKALLSFKAPGAINPYLISSE